jgi:hypothetical protein
MGSGGVPFLPKPGQPAPLQPGEYTPVATPTLVSFSFHETEPPAAVYIQRDDQLLFQATSLVAGEIVTFIVRLLRVDYPGTYGQPDSPVKLEAQPLHAKGFIDLHVFTLQVPTVGSFFSLTANVAEGYILSVTALAASAVVRGQTFVKASLTRGVGAGTIRSLVFFCDYVTLSQATGFPGGRIVASTEGPGRMRSVAVSAPLAGADWTITVPGTAHWRLVSASAIFAAAVAVANRIPMILIDDGANEVYEGPPNQVIVSGVNTTWAASTTVTGLAPNIPNVVVPIPAGLLLPPGFRISSETDNIQGADQWSQIFLLVEEWIDG